MGDSEQLGCWLPPACQTGKLPISCTTLWCILWWIAFSWSKSTDWTFHHLDTGGQLKCNTMHVDSFGFAKPNKKENPVQRMTDKGQRGPCMGTLIRLERRTDERHESDRGSIAVTTGAVVPAGQDRLFCSATHVPHQHPPFCQSTFS